MNYDGDHTHALKLRLHGGLACIVVLTQFLLLAFGDSSIAYAHGMETTIEVPEDFEPAAPIEGAALLARALYGHGRALLTNDQFATMAKIHEVLTAEISGMERMDGVTEPDPAAAARRRAYAEHLLMELIPELPRTIAIDVRDTKTQLDLQAPIRLPGDAGLIILRGYDGTGPTRFHLREINLQAQSEALPAEHVPYVSGGTTWIFLDIRNAPVGLTRFTIGLYENSTDEMPQMGKPLELSDAEFGGEFPLNYDEHMKIAMISLAAPEAGSLKLTLLDEAGHPTPAMLRLTSLSDGGLRRPANAVDLSPLFATVRGEPGLQRSAPETINIPGPFGGNYWCIPGPLDMVLPAGEWEIRFYRGTEYLPMVETVEIQAGEALEKTYTLERLTDMRERGWYSGDDHVHAQIMSNDDAERLLTLMQAVDVHVVSVLQMGNAHRMHYPQRGFGPAYRVRDNDYAIVPGQEDPRYWRGHAIGLNLTAIARDAEHYVLNDLVADAIHEQGGLYGFAHMCLTWFPIERDMTLLLPLGKADFGEILQFSRMKTDLYYDFLDLGYPLTASAGSDTPYGTGIGEARIYAYVGDEPFTEDAWFDAMKRGRTFVTNGPMVEFRINGAVPGDTIKVEGDETVRVHVRAWGVEGASAPARIAVIRNSEVIRDQKPDSGNSTFIEDEFDLRPGYGAWVAVRVYGRDGSEAHTTPVYLVREGFRFWNVARAKDLIDARFATIDEMEAELSAFEEMARSGATPVTDIIWANVLTNADALRERFSHARGVFQELELTLAQELRERQLSDPGPATPKK